MTIFDSNIWIALFHTSDNQHPKARRLAEAYSGKTKIALTEYVMTEVCSILLFLAGRAVVGKFITEVIRNQDIEILYSSPEFFNKTLKLFQELRYDKLSFTDVSLLFWSRFHEVTTFDIALARAIKKSS